MLGKSFPLIKCPVRCCGAVGGCWKFDDLSVSVSTIILRPEQVPGGGIVYIWIIAILLL